MSPLFQTPHNYFRIFRCYQKTKRRREEKRKRKLEEKNISDKMQFNWKSKKNLKASKKKFINWLKLDEFILVVYAI